jgi:hypothetical protein
VGELKFIDRNGIIRNEEDEMAQSVDEPPYDTPDWQNDSQPNKNSVAGFIPAAFRDHVPFLYAIHLWNTIIESKQ